MAQAVTAQMVSIFEGLIPANSVLGETVDQDAGGEKPGTRHELNRYIDERFLSAKGHFECYDEAHCLPPPTGSFEIIVFWSV